MDDTTGVRVPLVEEADATGRLAELYDDVRQATDLPFVPDMFRLVSTRPDLLEAVVAGYKAVFGDGVIPRAMRELICAWTARVNECPYCVGTHNFFFQAFGGSAEVGDAVAAAESPDELPVEEKTKVLLRLVTKVCREPSDVGDADWRLAFDAGWTREELVEAIFTSSLFNFVTRLVDCLGLGQSVEASRTALLDVAGNEEAGNEE